MRDVSARLRHGPIGAVVMLVLMVPIEVLALRAGSLGVVLLGGVAALAAVVVFTSADLVKVGLGATYLSAATLSWNGWFVGPLRPGDVLPLLALLSFAFGAPQAFRAPPWWIKQLAYGLVLLCLLLVLFPTPTSYLDQRTVLGAEGNPVNRVNTGLEVVNVLVTLKFVIAIAAIPVCFAAAALLRRSAVRWMAVLFCVGNAVQGFVAFADRELGTSIGQLLTGLPAQGDRAVGFSNHPNFLAEALVLAAPFACWLLTSHVRVERWVGAVSLVSVSLGTYASGSRGGTVCLLVAVVLAFVLLPRTRGSAPAIVLGGVAAMGVVAVVFPSVGLGILKATRLYGNDTTEGSDTVRERVADQGLRDFFFSPVKGIGMQASTDASQVYLQQLQAGGLVLFTIMSIYLVAASWDSFKLIRNTPIAAAICAAVVAKVPMNFVETSLTDRFYYLPEAILAALLAVTKGREYLASQPAGADAGDDEFAPRPKSGTRFEEAVR
ncbi:O-antigen ligase family protein [Jatrophihabitans fulvus]